MSQVYKATIIGSLSIVLWGALALFTTLTDGRIPAFQLMAMTFSVAFVLMAIRWIFKGHFGFQYLWQPPASWMVGVGGYFGYHFCYFLAMSKAPAIEVSLLAYLWPLLIVLLAALLPGEQLKVRHLVGAVMALTGCWLLISKDGVNFSAEYLDGYLLALACAFIWSTYSVVSRFFSKVPTDAVGWFCFITALLAVLCHLLWEQTVWSFDLRQWIGVIGLGLGPVGIAFFTWDYGVKHGNLQLLGVLAYATPLISILLLIVTGEAEPSWQVVWACLAIVSGSVLAGFTRARHKAQAKV